VRRYRQCAKAASGRVEAKSIDDAEHGAIMQVAMVRDTTFDLVNATFLRETLRRS
jgi:hypothetical protein